MAGYSGTPLVRKLGIKPGHRVALLGAPRGFALPDLPDGARVLRRVAAPLDVVVLFCPDRAALQRRFDAARAALHPAGRLWVCWPKKTSGIQKDLGEADVRAHGLASGLVDVKICAVDDTWSGLAFVVRVADRPKG